MSNNEDSWTIEEVVHIMLHGSNEEKEQVMASMIHETNTRLEHLENTLKGCKSCK